MNKNIAMLLLSVVLLAMILIILNQWAFGPSDAPQVGADFSDILKKSPVVKVPPNAPGVRVPVAGSGGAETNATDVGVTDMQAGAGTASGADSTAPAGELPATEENGAPTALVSPVSGKMAIGTPAGTSAAPVAAPVVTPPAAIKKPAPAPVTEEKREPQPVAKAVEAAPKTAAEGKTLAVNTLESVVFVPSGSSGVLEIKAAGKFEYKVFVLKGPQRVVVDLIGKFDKLATPSVKTNALVSAVRLAKHEDSVRIVLDIIGTTPRTWDAEQVAGKKLRVILK